MKHHPLLYKAYLQTCTRLYLNQWLYTKGGYDWDDMDEYCALRVPALAGVLGPQAGTQFRVCVCSTLTMRKLMANGNRWMSTHLSRSRTVGRTF